MINETQEWATGSFPVVEVATEAQLDPTPAALAETEGDTERAELAAGKCTYTWRNYPHETIHPESEAYRQHRCGRDYGHRGYCKCRYCGRNRGGA